MAGFKGTREAFAQALIDAAAQDDSVMFSGYHYDYFRFFSVSGDEI